MATEAGPGSGWRRIALGLPLALTAIIYLLSAGNRAVIDYDEGHYAQAALQMARSGDWVTPYVNGVRFLEKPPLIYWLSAASLKFLGVSEFALRLPTALGVIALVWLLMRTARRAASERAAAIGGLCTACSAGAYLFTRETLPDIWLVLFVTLAMYAFLEWYLDPTHRLRWAMLFYAAMAGAVMSKSLVGAAFPVGIVVLFYLLVWERPKWRTLHLVPGSLLFLLLVAPWHWLATARNPGFLWAFFVNEQVLRFFGKHDPPVLWSLPLLTFWVLIPLWFFPWTVFLPTAVAVIRRPADNSRRVLTRLALAWIVVILGFFSISGRLEHYAFPVIPALALLVGVALERSEGSGAVKWAFRALAVLGVIVLVGGVCAGVALFAAGPGTESTSFSRAGIIYETDFSILAQMPTTIRRSLLKPAVVTILSMMIGFPMALWFEAHRRRMAAVASVAAVMTALCGMTHWSLVLCEDMISSKKFALAAAREARPGDRLIVVGDYESANSLSFYQPLHVEVFSGVAYALIPGMKYHDAPRVVLTKEEFQSLWKTHGRVFVLAPRSRLSELRLAGPEILQVLDRVLIRNR
jgi:4-amino-4-deoxy-L-arabinose transferase-like glycosyltransferase